jgi:hypothetical protein
VLVLVRNWPNLTDIVVGQFATVDLDREVRDRQRSEHCLTIELELARGRGDDRNDAAASTGPELPHM